MFIVPAMHKSKRQLLLASVGALTPVIAATSAQAKADTCGGSPTPSRCFYVESNPEQGGERVTSVWIRSNTTLWTDVRFVGLQPNRQPVYSPIYRVPPKQTNIVCGPTRAALPCITWRDKTTLKLQSATQNGHGGWTFKDIPGQSVGLHK